MLKTLMLFFFQDVILNSKSKNSGIESDVFDVIG